MIEILMFIGFLLYGMMFIFLIVIFLSVGSFGLIVLVFLMFVNVDYIVLFFVFGFVEFCFQVDDGICLNVGFVEIMFVMVILLVVDDLNGFIDEDLLVIFVFIGFD